MAKGLMVTQFVFRDDDGNLTRDDAHELLDAWIKLCVERNLHTGGSIRLFDEKGMGEVVETGDLAWIGEDSERH